MPFKTSKSTLTLKYNEFRLNFPQFLYNVMRRCSFNPFQSKFSYQSRTNIFWRQIVISFQFKIFKMEILIFMTTITQPCFSSRMNLEWHSFSFVLVYQLKKTMLHHLKCNSLHFTSIDYAHILRFSLLFSHFYFILLMLLNNIKHSSSLNYPVNISTTLAQW